MTTGQQRPVVWVLLATYNGASFLAQQVQSILDQQDVTVHLLVSDDGSTDETLTVVSAFAQKDSRIELLPKRTGPAGVTGNFFYLLHCCVHDPRVRNTDFVAFSDQDDIWQLNKLASEVAQLRAQRAFAVSSNVTAFDIRGRRTLIRKDQPQRRWDYIFEAAGPGCTYVFRLPAARQLSGFIDTQDITKIGVHDWYVYALARARGWRWVTMSDSTVDYRQHGDNVQGANHGLGALGRRLKQLWSGFYREQFLVTARAAKAFAGPSQGKAWNQAVDALIEDLAQDSLAARVRVVRRWPDIRRRRVEAFFLALGCLFYVW